MDPCCKELYVRLLLEPLLHYSGLNVFMNWFNFIRPHNIVITINGKEEICIAYLWTMKV
jgi:hypothetical protein